MDWQMIGAVAAVVVPVGGLIVGLVVMSVNRQFDLLIQKLDRQFDAVNRQFDAVNEKFAGSSTRSTSSSTCCVPKIVRRTRRSARTSTACAPTWPACAPPSTHCCSSSSRPVPGQPATGKEQPAGAPMTAGNDVRPVSPRRSTRSAPRSAPDAEPWIVAYSGGKERSCCVWEVAAAAEPAAADLRRLQRHAGRPLVIERRTPSAPRPAPPACRPVHRPDVVIGRGYIPPTRNFRWCTDRLPTA